MIKPGWEDQSLVAKLSFDGYIFHYFDGNTGIREVSLLTSIQRVEECWKTLARESRVSSLTKIVFPTWWQLLYAWTLVWSNDKPLILTDSSDNVLWVSD